MNLSKGKILERAIKLMFLMILPIMSTACSDCSSMKTHHKNREKTPPNNYTGNWVVYATNNCHKIIEVCYKNGKKNGIEMRWYPDTGYKMSLHTFDGGVLDGKVVKWRNDKDKDVLAKGYFLSGQPWNGTFLENWEGELDRSLKVTERNLPYGLREYKDGKLVKRFAKP